MARGGTVRVSITGDTRGLDRATRGAEGSLNRLSRGGSRALRGLGTAAKLGGAALTAGLVVAAKGAVEEFREAQKVTAQTGAVIKSTGGAAGVSAKQVADLAAAISLKAGIDDEAIQSGQNLLLTFTNIRNEAGRGNDIFDQATSIMTDMSVALGQDMKSSAIQLGKALNDPIKGVTALQRVGVSFTADQKEQIKSLVESGRSMDAQKLILRELNREFAGSAAAQADPFDKAKVAVQNLQEALGTVLAPALASAATGVATFVVNLQRGTGTAGRMRDAVVTAFEASKQAVQTAVTAVTGFLARNRSDINATISAFRTIGEVVKFVFLNVMLPIAKRTFGALVQTIKGALQVIQGIVRVFAGVLTGDFGKAWQGVKGIFGGGVKVILGTLHNMTAPAREGASRIGQGISAAFRGAWSAVKSVFSSGTRTALGIVKAATSPHRTAAKGVGDAVVTGFNAVKGVVGLARDAFKSAREAISGGANRARSVAGQIASAVMQGVAGLPGLMLQLGKRAAQSLIDGLKSLADKAKDALSSLKPRVAFDPTAFIAPPSGIGFPKLALTEAGKKKGPKKEPALPPLPPALTSFLSPLSIRGARGAAFDTKRAAAELAVSRAESTTGAAYGTPAERGVEDDIRALDKLIKLIDGRIKYLRKKVIPADIKATRNKKKGKKLKGGGRAPSTAEKGRANLLRHLQELQGLVSERNTLAAGIAELGGTVPAPDTGAIETGTVEPETTTATPESEAAPAETAPADTGPSPDLQAQVAQAEARAAVAEASARISGAGLATFQGAADIGYGRPFIVINTLHPGDSKTLAAVGDAATKGISLTQGSVISPRTPAIA